MIIKLNIYVIMVMCIMVIGFMDSCMEMESIGIEMGNYIKDNGLKGSNMGKE